jgi:hypothetical protein
MVDTDGVATGVHIFRREVTSPSASAEGGLTLLKPRCITGRVSETDRDVTIGFLQFCSYPVVFCPSLAQGGPPAGICVLASIAHAG